MSEIEQEWKENTRLDGRIEEKKSKNGFDFHFGGNLAAKSGSDKAESRTKNGVGARFEYTGIVRSCPETWLRPVQNFSSFAFTKPQLLDFASVGANRGKKKKGKNKKKPFRCFDVSTFPSFSARLARNEAQNRLYPRIVRRGKYVSKVCQSRDRKKKKKNRKNWVGKISAEILVPPARRSWVEERNKGKRREREREKIGKEWFSIQRRGKYLQRGREPR